MGSASPTVLLETLVAHDRQPHLLPDIRHRNPTERSLEGRYTIERKVGEGGAAEETTSGENVCIREITKGAESTVAD